MKLIRSALILVAFAGVFACGSDESDDWLDANCKAGIQVEGRECPPPESGILGV